MRTTAIFNLKGGVAKTVTTVNLAAVLARDYGQRVLLIDADSQANMTEFMRDPKLPELPSLREGLADLLKGFRVPVRETQMLGIRMLPATDALMDLDVSKAGSGEADVMALAEFLEERRGDYDTVLIDCPPAFSAAAMAALCAADDVIIPVKLDAFSVRGLANMMAQVRNMKRVNPGLEVAGVLPTMWYRTQAMEVAELGLKNSGLPVFPHISRSISVDRSTFDQRPLIYSSPNCSAARDYRKLAALYTGGSEEDAALAAERSQQTRRRRGAAPEDALAGKRRAAALEGGAV